MWHHLALSLRSTWRWANSKRPVMRRPPETRGRSSWWDWSSKQEKLDTNKPFIELIIHLSIYLVALVFSAAHKDSFAENVFCRWIVIPGERRPLSETLLMPSEVTRDSSQFLPLAGKSRRHVSWWIAKAARRKGGMFTSWWIISESWCTHIHTHVTLLRHPGGIFRDLNSLLLLALLASQLNVFWLTATNQSEHL